MSLLATGIVYVVMSVLYIALFWQRAQCQAMMLSKSAHTSAFLLQDSSIVCAGWLDNRFLFFKLARFPLIGFVACLYIQHVVHINYDACQMEEPPV